VFPERFADNLVLSLLDAHAMLVMSAELYGEGKNKTEPQKQAWLRRFYKHFSSQ